MSPDLPETNPDVLSEQLIKLTAAAALVPGRPVCRQTIHRWAFRGVHGIKLETCAIGSVRWTSHEALGRFLAALNQPSSRGPFIHAVTPNHEGADHE